MSFIIDKIGVSVDILAKIRLFNHLTTTKVSEGAVFNQEHLLYCT